MTLRRQIKDLIELLVKLELSRSTLEDAFLANRNYIGDSFRPGQKRPGYASTFKRLFNFKGNDRKYLGTEQSAARLAIDYRHIRCVWGGLTALGFQCGAEWADAGPAAWSEELARAQTVVAGGLNRQDRSFVASPPLIAHPRWRLVERPDVASAILDRLEAVGAVALTGMPGIGKSVLARQVAAGARQRGLPVVEPGAGPWLHTDVGVSGQARPPAADQIGLWATVLRQLAGLEPTGLTRTQRVRFSQAVGAFLQQWSDGSDGLRPSEKRLIERIEDRPAPAAIRAIILAHATDLRGPQLTASLCRVLRAISPDALVFLDNVADIERAQATCLALFGRDPNGRPSPLRLLLTSQRAVDDLAFLVGAEDARASAKIASFEDRTFALRVVAAWAVAGDEDRAQRQADADIELFRVMRMARDAVLTADIGRVVAAVGGHALALAALASVWRYGGHRRSFWRKALAAIQATPADILQLEVPRDPDHAIERRHLDVLQALRLAWALLNDGQSDWEATRERFLDLGVSPPNRPIDERVFNEFWQRVGRGPRRQHLGPALAPRAMPLRRLQAASFVQPLDGEPGQFVLHDLHRVLIEHELGGRAGLAARHRDLLRAFGWLDADGSLRSDEEALFAVEAGRTVLKPDLGSDPDEAATAEVARYLLEALPHHVANMATEASEAQLVALATSYRFLQARLDAADRDGRRPIEQGNVEFLTAVFRQPAAPPLPQVRHAARLAAAGIGLHRRQLAGQLLARLPAHQGSALDGLRAGASRYGLRPGFTPEFPLLVDPPGGPQARIAAPHGFGGAEWVVTSGQPPRILTWSNDAIALWNPELGEINLSFPHGGRIARAKWITDAPGGPAILGWSFMGHSIALWDAGTGEPRVQIETDHIVDEARWIGDGPDGPVVMSWSKFKPSPICLWDARTRDGLLRDPCLRLEHAQSHAATSGAVFGAGWIAATPDGPAIFAWSTTERTIRVWDAKSGEERQSLRTPEPLRGATWIPDAIDGPGILSWSSRGGVRVWDASSRVARRLWLPSSNELSCDADDAAWMCGAEWITDGPRGPAVLWWSRFDRRAHLWDVASGDTLAELPHAAGVAGAQWIAGDPGGPAILTTSPRAVHLWDAVTGRHRGSVQDGSRVMEAHWVAKASDGAPGILSWWDDRTIRLHDVDLGQERVRITPREGISAVEWIDAGPDGPAIMTSSSYTPGAVCLWNPVNHVHASDVGPRHSGLVWGVAWVLASSRPAEIISWSTDHTVRIRDAARGEERLKVTHDKDVSHADWIPTTPAGPAILTCSDDQTVRLWADADGKPLARTDLKSRGMAGGMSWTKGTGAPLTIVIWHFHALIHLWKPWTGRKDIEIYHEKLRGVRQVDDALGAPAIFSWASGDRSLRCWDLATGDERGCFEGPAAVEGADWIPRTPEGPAILGWAGTSVVSWDAATGNERFHGRHDRAVVGASWIADAGGTPGILSSSYDKTIRMWDLSGAERLRLDSEQSAPFAFWIDETPTGSAILSWSIIDRQISLWDLSTKRRRVHVRHDEHVIGATYIPDPARPAILSWAKDRTIRLWDAASSDLIARFDLDAEVVSLKVRNASREDLQFAIGCTDGTVGSLSLRDL